MLLNRFRFRQDFFVYLMRNFAHKEYDRIQNRLLENKFNWNLNDTKIQQALTMILYDQTFDLVAQNDLCLFLYAKGIKSENPSRYSCIGI
jgi:hypothetical protein